MTWKCHVDESTKSRYDMILGRYLLTKQVLNIKCSNIVIAADDIPFKGATASMFYLGTYVFKDLNTG